MTDQHQSEVTKVIPLGGVGEFGANATVIQTAETSVLLDYGLMFPPDSRQPGVEFYVNDPDLVLDQFPEISAVFLTHGHEDHIGGLAFLLKRMNIPIYTTSYTARLLKKTFRGLDFTPHIELVSINQPVNHGDISVEFVRVTHSIAHACALWIKTPGGGILHTGDFKVDPLPLAGNDFQSNRLREIGDEGVALLIMDSTNALKPGFSPSEDEILPAIERQILDSPGRVFLTTFSSHMPRLAKLRAIAKATGRKIAIAGSGFQRHFKISIETGYMGHESDVFATLDQALGMPDDRVLFMVTGSQGESQSALSRIRTEGHKGLKFKAGDSLLFSSKAIPGNERQIMLLISDLERRGIRVVTGKEDGIHTSGHGHREDLAYMLSLTRPHHVAPIHGEFLQLQAQYRWLKALVGEDQHVLLIEDGDVLEVTPGCTWIAKQIETGLLPVDGNQNQIIERSILKDRKDMMYSGMVLISVMGPPTESLPNYHVSTNGVVEDGPGAIADHLREGLERISLDSDQSPVQRADGIFRESRRLLKKKLYGRPLIKIILNGEIVR